MNRTMKRCVSFALTLVMVIGLFAGVPFTAFAANDYNINSTTSTDNYYNQISKKDWDIAPGITESEIVLNNDAGTKRQVLFVMEADLNNEYVKVTHSYTGMVPKYGSYTTGVMSEQAAWAEANGYGNIVGGMNTCLSWYTGYPADRIGEPLGFIMMDAEILFDPGNCGYAYGNVGFPSVVVINKDFDENGNPRPADIPKVEMPQIRSAADLDGWEDQVIPCSSGYIVKDGVNQYKPDHSVGSEAPRSVVGIKPDGKVVIMLNDGRQSPYSAGMSMYELAEVMLDLGCSFAVNCDGGGSSTWLSQRPGEDLKVNNSPSDGAERPTTSGIFFISTAPSTNEFVRAEVSTSHDYYTPGTEVHFNALATNLVGEQVDMPEDISWQLADPSVGTITADGVFKSNGTLGRVTAQIVHDGKVKGEKEIQIVWPTDFAFASDTMTVPFGKTVAIELVATYNGAESYVALKNGDVEFQLSDATLGTISGYNLTANADENAVVTSGTLTATINGLTAVANIALGKGSEIVLGFESATDKDDWLFKDYNVYTTGSVKDVVIENAVQIVTPETGKVHSGDSAMAVTMDYSNGNSGGWTQFRLFYDGEYIEVANAKRIGFWIWMPDEAYANEIDLNLSFINEDGTQGKGSPVLTDIGYCISGQDEAGWRYFTADLSQYPIFYLGKHENPSLSRQFCFQFYNYTNQWQKNDDVVNTMSKFTYFIDDITIEYSDATDDANAPVFGEVNLVDVNGVASVMNGQTIAFNTFGAEVSVKDFAAGNASGLNVSSAKAYVDGEEVNCTYAGGRISISDVTVPDGLHTVKFAICDNMGNLNSVIRQVVVDADSGMPTINLVPHDASLTNLPLGSVYYVDLVATDIEKVQKFTADLDLINTFGWELAYAQVADGFELSYEIDKYTNVATITVVRSGNEPLTGNQVIASIPVRVWDATYDTGTRNGNKLTEVWLTIKGMGGQLICVDGKVSTFTCDPVKVATELWMNQWNMPTGFTGLDTHKHTTIALGDKSEDCTATGYTDRTFCEGCNSVVDWGTTVPAKGHDLADTSVDGLHTCADCGDVFYYVGGTMQKGWIEISGNYYYFNDSGVAVDGKATVDGHTYTFTNHVLTDGAWEEFAKGHVVCWWAGEKLENTWFTIGGKTYYFITEVMSVGIQKVAYRDENGMRDGYRYYVFAPDGVWMEDYTGFYSDGINSCWLENGVAVYKGLCQDADGNYYYMNSRYLAIKNCTYSIGASKTNGLLPAGKYAFDADGKMINPPVAEKPTVPPVTEPSVTEPPITEPPVTEPDVKNGLIIDADGNIRFYVNGEATYAGLVQDAEGNYYYINSSKKAVKNCTYSIGASKTNGLLPAGKYEFGADGKMVNPPAAEEPTVPSVTEPTATEPTTTEPIATEPAVTEPISTEPAVKNGLVADEDGNIRFYENGVAIYAGLVQDAEGNYYYINSGKKAVKNCTYSIGAFKTNGLLPAGKYAFGADGKMINPPEVENPTVPPVTEPPVTEPPVTEPPTTEPDVKNGLIVDDDGNIRFYENGVAIYAGLVQDAEGNYYYINSSKKAVKNCTYSIGAPKTNGLLPAGKYVFGADGKMIVG